MYLEAMIMRSCRPYFSESGDILGGHDRASLEMHLEAMIDWDWTCTWRWLMDGVPGAETLFIN